MSRKLTAHNAKQIGGLVQTARQAKGATLQDVCAATGMHWSQLSRIERGVFKTASGNVRQVCKYLGVPVGHLIQQAAPLAVEVARVAAQSKKNKRVLEAILYALDDSRSLAGSGRRL